MKSKIRFFLLLVLYLLVINVPFKSYSQPQDIKDALESISKMTGGGSDRTSSLLKEAGFIVPESLKTDWEGFSAYVKIETAYWIAEKSPGNGEKLLAILSTKLANEFESVTYEQPLKKLLAIKVRPDEKLFIATVTSFQLPPEVPKEIANNIMSIAKYTDSKVFGGTRGILKYYFGLSDEHVIEILRKSANNYDALLTGINEASIPPSQKERIKKIIRELFENFESASLDEKLLKILEESKPLRAKPGTALKTSPPKAKLKTEYSQFMKKSHPTEASKKFSEMRVNAEGFGGIIFGNRVTGKNLSKIQSIAWIHGKGSKDIDPAGTLEFIFKDSLVKIIPNVLWEDVYAAYNIVYADNLNAVNNENGIGLTGASFPEVYNEDRIYDSLIKSNHLTQNETGYYNFRCRIKKSSIELNKKTKNDIAQINAWDQRFRSADSILSNDLEMMKINRKLNREVYESHLRAAKIAHSNRRNALNEYFRDTLAYKKLDESYQTGLKEWEKKDSLATVNIDEYISKTNKIILYPIVANLELGRSLIRADVMPRDSAMLISKIKKIGADESEIKVCSKWLKGTDTLGWKFTDDSLFIIANGDLLQVVRQSDIQNPGNGLLNFNTINTEMRTTISTDFPEFKMVNPILTRVFYDYYRVNNFAKIMAIFRWAKRNGAKFLNKPATPPLYIAPTHIIISKDGTIDLVDMK